VTFERALALLGPADSSDAAEALLQLADLHATSLARPAEGIAYAERALTMVERIGDRRLEATACCVVGNVRARINDLRAGRSLLERALALALELDDPALATEACSNLANVHGWLGNLARGRSLSMQREALARRTQDPFHLRHVYSSMGFNDVLQGDWANAERRFAQQEQVIDGLQSPEPRITLLISRGWMLYLRGRFAEAEGDYRAVVETVRQTGAGTLVWYLGPWALAQAELAHPVDALATLEELWTLADALDEQARVRGFAFAHLVTGYSRLGARDRAAACYTRLLPLRGQISPILIDRALGVAAAAAGDSAAAEQHLAAASSQAERAGMRPELALTWLQLGLLKRAGGPTPDRTPLDTLGEGLRLCAKLGMEELGRRIVNGILSERVRLPADAGHARLSER
jgi:tetratricopeptide (TPR) repeat protein